MVTAVVVVVAAAVDRDSPADRFFDGGGDDDDDEMESWLGGETEGRGRGLSHPDPRVAAYCGIRLQLRPGLRTYRLSGWPVACFVG